MKKVLLIGGGGTLGTYTAKELLRLGHCVDVICLEDHVSDNERLTYYKEYATVEFLEQLFAKTYYDGIVNFLHNKNYKDYPPFHALLSRNTDHLIFLSSYRVYADLQHPITEDAPQLIDVIKDDPLFLEEETYAMSKSRSERFLADNPYPKNWTIVRPVISFSAIRMDLIMTGKTEIVDAKREGRKILLPLSAKNLTAGLDWAGNSGKLIANLLFKEETIGQAYTVSSAQNLTWGEVADIYTDVLGVEFEWTAEDYRSDNMRALFRWKYDRAYDRCIDNTKVLAATGLTSADFKSIREGIIIELNKLGFATK